MSFRNRITYALVAAALCLGLAACGPRPDEASQRRIVLMLQNQIGAVKSFHFLDVANRCQLEFECFIIPYRGTPGRYRGSYGYGILECDPVEPDVEPAAR
jgi:hypothetical protein